MIPRCLTTILVILFSCNSITWAIRSSGLYVDNGFDQTLMHRVASPREQLEVEHEILSLLGLPERPPRSHGTPQVRRSAPKFLLDIYKNALDSDNKNLSRLEYDLSGQDVRAIEQSDVIMSFGAKGHHVPGVRHERGKRLFFDVSEASQHERVLGAELRLYRSLAHAKSPKFRGSYSLTVYRVLRLEDGERELQYVNSVNTTGDGWISLNVSAAMKHWLNEPRSNRGIYLSVHPSDRHVHEVKPEDVGILGLKGHQAVDKQPFMVGFFKSSVQHQQKAVAAAAITRSHLGARTKRDLGRRAGASGNKRRTDVSLLPEYHNPYVEQMQQQLQQHSNPNLKTCKLQTLYVSFKDLQWQDWIIAPDGYDAYYCSGECNFPLNAHMNATNHAIVQTLVHLWNPGKVPKPCCAPTKLSPISVLYFLDESNVILKKYKNMVVKSCGCH
ncbi:hypothetical protein QAD02_004623 [Eretmocerus hayati]|uniref:Uncharacterized protein n=1 Tax=Eretmocerus hayati TaxID=131215 RepID=A0ACC2NRX6_9HYME|nr:hypothetical protein QAD02_004623 [Eretmocerus hayati]